MLTQSATHRGAPFVGRGREIGILTHLIKEGLEGETGLIRVSGEAGMGRRRVIAEALSQGPDAEWIHLAAGDVEADLRRWVRTELFDLLDTYPDLPYPSWALHTLAGWAPALRRRAAVPAVAGERPPRGMKPEVLGRAVGSLLHTLTGRTLVLVDAGLWPNPETPRSRLLDSMTQALSVPGALTLTAAPPPDTPEVDKEGVRTLSLGPLRRRHLEDLLEAWTGDLDETLAAWLWRVSHGHPFFVHEVVRWLEEMGHVRVDEEHKRIEVLSPTFRLPVPMHLHAVMESRHGRLPPPATRLLHLLRQVDGRLEVEAVRRLYDREDEEFEEALSVLRRREFLLRRTSRRPLAMSSPAWQPVIDEAAKHYPRHAYRPPRNGDRPPRPATPLAQTLGRLETLRWKGLDREQIHGVLASARRIARGRLGPAWDGVRGRLAVAAARQRLEENRLGAASLWVRWGRDRLSAQLHPALRRGLCENLTEILERQGKPAEAARQRRVALHEAVESGHWLAAAQIRAAIAEGERRLGNLGPALAESARAEAELATMGLSEGARLARWTRLRTLLADRRLDEIDEILGTESHEPDPELEEMEKEMESLRRSPPLSLGPRASALAQEWGWGLDAHDIGLGYEKPIRDAWRAGRRDGALSLVRRLKPVRDHLERVNHQTALVDLDELELWARGAGERWSVPGHDLEETGSAVS